MVAIFVIAMMGFFQMAMEGLAQVNLRKSWLYRPIFFFQMKVKNKKPGSQILIVDVVGYIVIDFYD